MFGGSSHELGQVSPRPLQTPHPTASSQHDKGPESGPPGAHPRHQLTHPVQGPQPHPPQQAPAISYATTTASSPLRFSNTTAFSPAS